MTTNPAESSTHPATPLPWWTVGRVSWALGVLAGLLVVLTLAGPGITTDEPLDVRPGRTYVATLRARGLRFFDRATVDAVFRDNAEHPPLGRWLLGIASTLGQPFETWLAGADPVGLYLYSGRLAPASAFGALVVLVARAAGSRHGRAGAVAAGSALVLMPRAFAHAHLGALDTFVSLFWTLALVGAERATRGRRPVLVLTAAGLLWGLALLTKIHAWFLPPLVLLGALARLRPGRAVVGFVGWAATGLGLFFLGWPWLWFDTAARLRGYLGTGVVRTSLKVLYFGHVYADRDVPWHYPWFYFAATVPVGLHLLGVLGLARGLRGLRDDHRSAWLAGTIVLFLAVFSTRIPVYDGERLFLLVFPAWAILIGQGFAGLWMRGARRLRGLLAAFLVAQAYGVVALHPFGLSYYNALVGGLPGAERRGLELTYWGDAVDPVLLDRLAAEARAEESAALVPTLYPGQGLASTSRTMARLPVLLRDEENAPRARWLVVSRRTAYWPPGLADDLARGHLLATRSRQGVWLAGLWRRPDREAHDDPGNRHREMPDSP